MADAMHDLVLDEASYSAATELARLQGGPVEVCVASAIKDALAAEQVRQHLSNAGDRAERDRQARVWLARWHEILGDPPPLSDHSWLYDDETGLPV